MMEEGLLEFAPILILVNGFFAATEIAVFSSRGSRLRAMAAADDSGGQRVLAPRENSEHAAGRRRKLPPDSPIRKPGA